MLVHELAHLVVADHSPAFQVLVDRYPKAERARGFLMAKSFGDDDVADGDRDDQVDEPPWTIPPDRADRHRGRRGSAAQSSTLSDRPAVVGSGAPGARPTPPPLLPTESVTGSSP